MKTTRILLLTFLSLVLVSTITTRAQAQNDGSSGANTGNTDTGSTAGTDSGGSIDASQVGISDEAFTIDRGETAGGGSQVGGFGIASETGNGGRTAGGAGGGGFGGIGGLGALGNLFGGGGLGAGGQRSAQPIIRTRLRSAVGGPPLAPVQVQTGARRTFSQLPPQRQLGGVNVQMQGRTAILTGAVDSERDRRMAHLLMRLEPGVSRVQNRIRIQP